MDADAFAEALKPHYDDVLRYCRALCAQSPSRAEDVIQQSLLKAFERFASLRDEAKFRQWLFRIVTRTFYSSIRRSFWRRFVPLSEAPEVDELPSVYGRPERHDDRQRLLTALAQLPRKQRAAVLLFEIGGFSIEEIAALQGDGSTSAVKSRLSRGRRKLRDLLEEHEGDVRRPPVGGDGVAGDLDHETLHLLMEMKHETR